MKRQSGFTLIELIIVIVILGILAVTAAPQFFNFGGDARESTVRAMESSVKSAADMVYARAAIEGQERQAASENNTVNIGSGNMGDTVAIAFGYPTAAGLQNALNVNVNPADEGDPATGDWNFSVGDNDTSVTITPAGFATEDGDCEVVYTQAGEVGERPTIETSVEGC